MDFIDSRVGDRSVMPVRPGKRLMTALVAGSMLLTVGAGCSLSGNTDIEGVDGDGETSRTPVPTKQPAAPRKTTVPNADQHPFLITTKDEFAELRAKSNQKPWSVMKVRARQDCNQLNYLPKASVMETSVRIRDITGACALMYVLDPSAKKKYRGKITDGLEQWDGLLKRMDDEYPKAKNRWLDVVPPSSGYFNSVLALDVIHDDLSPKQLAAYEKSLGAVADWYWAEKRGWGTATYGSRAIWATYQGDKERLPKALDQYRSIYLDWLWRDGPEYVLARMGGERTAKTEYIHVAEKTGADPNYYNDPLVEDLYEFILGSAYGPANEMVGFGDAGPAGRNFNSFTPQSIVFNAGKVSKKAAGYAAYRQQVGIAAYPSDLLTYATATKPAKPVTPVSRAFTEGGAFFWERSSSPNALMGSIWNIPEPGEDRAHSHQDTNALYLIAGGKPVLVNSGYNGAGKGEKGFDAKYIHGTAESSNTVTIAGAGHDAKSGEGISESLVSKGFDYASGSADKIYDGPAKHVRNFMMVHPEAGASAAGYFIAVDEITGVGPGDQIDAFWHPAAVTAPRITNDSEYTWKVRGTSSNYMSLFLADKPTGTKLKKGVVAGWGQGYIGSYLDASYEADESGRSSTVTVLFPSDATHAKAGFGRVGGPNYSGATVKQGKAVDYVLESNGAAAAKVDTAGAEFTGSAAVIRQLGKKTGFYFVRGGTEFASADGQGFSADQPVSVHMRGKKGTISTSKASTVTFHNSAISKVAIDGKAAAVKPGKRGLAVTIPAGSHLITLS